MQRREFLKTAPAGGVELRVRRIWLVALYDNYMAQKGVHGGLVMRKIPPMLPDLPPERPTSTIGRL